MSTETAEKVGERAECVVEEVKHTKYQHKSYIDEATGTYDVDCNGFVAYVLQGVAPEHYHEIPKESDLVIGRGPTSITTSSPTCPKAAGALNPPARGRPPRGRRRLAADRAPSNSTTTPGTS